MAKAQFHKNQRVYVKPVGTWALIEHVVPHWAKGLDEPIRIHYDVGLAVNSPPRNCSARNRWATRRPTTRGLARGAGPQQMATRRGLRPPSRAGTYPVVITGERNGAAGACRARNMIWTPPRWKNRPA